MNWTLIDSSAVFGTGAEPIQLTVPMAVVPLCPVKPQHLTAEGPPSTAPEPALGRRSAVMCAATPS
jgi:hypothetical protein